MSRSKKSTSPPVTAEPLFDGPAVPPVEVIVSSEQALSTREGQRPLTVEDLMARAIEKGDTETMSRLFEMRREMRAEAAEEAFSEAMKQAQSEMRPISADATNPQTRSEYASYAQLDRALRPLYTKNGFALGFNSDKDTPPGYVHVFCDVSHSGGCTRRYWCPLMPADGKGAKGGDVMTLTHAAASGITYSMRYLVKMIFNVAVGEDDDDGNGGGELIPLSEGQLLDLDAKIEEVGANRALFLKYFEIERLEDLSAARFGEAIRALEDKARRGQR